MKGQRGRKGKWAVFSLILQTLIQLACAIGFVFSPLIGASLYTVSELLHTPNSLTSLSLNFSLPPSLPPFLPPSFTLSSLFLSSYTHQDWWFPTSLLGIWRSDTLLCTNRVCTDSIHRSGIIITLPIPVYLPLTFSHRDWEASITISCFIQADKEPCCITDRY